MTRPERRRLELSRRKAARQAMLPDPKDYTDDALLRARELVMRRVNELTRETFRRAKVREEAQSR